MSSGSSTADLSSSGTSVEEFIENYYEQLAAEDARQYSPETLRTRATKHRALAASRRAGGVAVDVLEEDDASIILVVTDDIPFLVDSVTAEIVRQNAAIQLVIHPTFVATRDQDSGQLVRLDKVPSHAGISNGDTAAIPSLAHLLDGKNNTTLVESWIAVEVRRLKSPESRQQLIDGVTRVLGDAKSAVEDWSAMRAKAREIAEDLKSLPQAEAVPDLDQARELLTWLDKGNFTFLGFREYDLKTVDSEDVLFVKDGSGLGLMRDVRDGRKIQHLTTAGKAKARESRALVVTKANSRSTVHRAAYLDYIGIKRFDAQGNVDGERRFIGLFSTTAYTDAVRRVPVVRDKVDAVLRKCGFHPNSHSGKDLMSILETYPRDELFQIDADDMASTAMGILRLQERRRTRLFLRPDVYGRFMSAVIYLPRDRYTTNTRLRIEDELRQTFNAEAIEFEARMSESALTRLFFRIRLPRGGEAPDVDSAALEQRLVQSTRSWSEGMEEVTHSKFGREKADYVSSQWAEAFPPSYRVLFEVEDALDDIERFESYESGGSSAPVLQVYVPSSQDASKDEDARLNLYLREPKSLSQILPHLHNLGLEVLDERPFEINRADGTNFYLYDLGLRYPDGIDPMKTAQLLEDAFGAAMTGQSESDEFDRMVLAENMQWRQVLVLRSYAKYMRQLGNVNSYGFIADTLLANPVVARALVELFEARFNPDLDTDKREAAVDAVQEQLKAGLEEVSTLDADRVLRTVANLIESTLRTNFFQEKSYVSFKLDTLNIDAAPFPRPKFEIWVYSPRVEGVHLRFGDVARGGLRWSDRREDFRTEVLGLVKAQTVKNAVIVPSGAKGGFFAKQLPDPALDRGAWMDEGKESYKIFIRGLLDVTDNLVSQENGQSVVAPERVVRHDGEDSYLVVAADKGTASFSDTANALSAEYNFWLGDAFASGGSVGYDHKAMGITARGAWVSVKWHFREFGIDTQAEDFTVVGIGDMSGDVFGNGMMASEHIRLVAAFDHRHIFLDPSPVAETSYAERVRLFNLPRSSWADYDPTLISPGGGVFARSRKSVPISDEIRQVLGLGEDVTSLSPPELLRTILSAPVDLLYNGGIGTYIKASTESHADVGDKANDAIRVDGADIQARVIGEGGNLGMTQRGRIEAARNGVILNTDAIDNSAGVDCSDHEVNIKIFVDRMVEAGKLAVDERAEFLHSMTDEVARLVLQDNTDQNILLLNDRQRVVEWSPSFERLMDHLEEHAGLNRELEFLPTTKELHERLGSGEGLTSPELAVLAAYAKIELAKELTDSDLADDPWFARTLRSYFPRQLVERFDEELDTHPLRREIVATVVANDMINMGGITFAFRVMEETSVSAAAVARAFAALREIFEFDEMVDSLASMPAKFPVDRWCTVYLDMRRLLDRAVRWFANHVSTETDVGQDVAHFKPLIDPLRTHLVDYAMGSDLERIEEWREKAARWGLPESVGRHWAEQFESYGLLDIAYATQRIDEPVEEIAKVYYAIYDRFDVDSLLTRISQLPREDRWQALARAALRDDLYSTIADMTYSVMRATTAGTRAIERLADWEAQNALNLERATKMFDEVNRLERDDMASLSVALRHLRSVVRR